MNLCLVTAPIATDLEDPGDAASAEGRAIAEAPHLGVLALAGALEQAGIRPHIFNTDDAFYAWSRERPGESMSSFAGWAADRIRSTGSDLFGFSTICSSYPLTVRIAEQLKRAAPDCSILFGGPQASAVDRQTLEAFPFVDFVLRGEADFTLPVFLREFAGARRFADVPALAYRSPFGVQRTGEAPLIDDLDSLPLPAYHLTGELTRAPYCSLELGRGCPFSCTFCSTNDFFRRRFRVKSPPRLLADMRAIAARWGIRTFNLVHDMFTVDRKRVAAFCEEMIASGENFVWTCSARTDCVDSELLALMARAGCDGVFFGVETGSQRMQRIIDKDLDIPQAKSVISEAERHGLATTVSLITGFPEETPQDLRETVDVFMHSLRHPRSQPQLNVLAPLSGTPVFLRHKHEMYLEELCSEMSHQGRMHNESDRQMIRRHPEIFPNFYILATPGLDRAEFLEFHEFLLVGSERFRWLLVALDQARSGIFEVLQAWRARRLEIRPELAGFELRNYYRGDSARRDFLAFLRERLADFGSPAVEALLAYHEAVAEPNVCMVRFGAPAAGKMRPGDFAARIGNVHVLELDWDIQAVIDSLKRGDTVGEVRRRKLYRTGEVEGGNSRLIEVTPLIAAALRASDGSRTVREIANSLGPLFDCPECWRRLAGEELLRVLREEGLVQIYRAAPARQNAGLRPARRIRQAAEPSVEVHRGL